MGMRVLITGSRAWPDGDPIIREMRRLGSYRDTLFIHGACPTGADQICAWTCKRYGFPVKAFPANWEKHGRAAGPLRNQQMIDEGKPNLVLAFPLPGGLGTQDMIDRALASRIETGVYDPKELRWFIHHPPGLLIVQYV